MKITKVISVLMALAIMLSLCACGGSGAADEKNEGTVTHSENSLWNKKFEGITLKRILWYEPSDSEKALVKEFTDRTGCEIVDEVVDYQNYNNKIAGSIAAGDPYDIGYIYGAFFPTQIIAGMYQPINAYMGSEYLLDASSSKTIANGGFDINKMDFYKWNNNYYGFSSYWDVDMLVMYFRKDLIAEAGLKSPLDYVKSGDWNLDTFKELATKLTNAKAKKFGYSAGGENTRGYGEFVRAFGTSFVVYDSNGIPSENLGDPKILDGFNFVQKMTYGAGSVVDGDASFRKGTAAMAIDGLYEAPKFMNDKNVPNAVKNNWDIAPIPLAANNKGGAYPTDWLKAIGIVNGSKNPEAVAAFALHMSKGKGDNIWEEYLTEEQIERVTPYYSNINYTNYAYGSLVEDLSTLMGRVAQGEDVSQLISEYRTTARAQIEKIIKE